MRIDESSQASATIDSKSKSYEERPLVSTDWVQAPQHSLVASYAHSVHGDQEQTDRSYDTGVRVRDASDKSHYDSRHTVDKDGHAQGGHFDADSHRQENHDSRGGFNYDFGLFECSPRRSWPTNRGHNVTTAANCFGNTDGNASIAPVRKAHYDQHLGKTIFRFENRRQVD